MTRHLKMVQVDVFSSEVLRGNPLAVFLDGRGLSDQEMQALAREMNLSETTFILPRDPATENASGIRVRIFTVQEELPFAGHPTLGTAFVLRGSTGASEIVSDLNVGKVPVRFEDRDGKPSFGEMTQVDPTFGPIHDTDGVSRACGLSADAIDSSVPIQTVSTGLPYVIVPLRSLEAMHSLSLDPKRIAEYMDKTDGRFFYFVSRETVDPAARLHARMLFYNGEDPATGSAGGCAAAWMVAHRVAQPEERVPIEQGIEMNRPSRIFVRAGKKDNRVINVRVGGHATEIMRGEVFLP
jgi:trans-2,3-dihydro-3-hydroxyanthranilate isomerase